MFFSNPRDASRVLWWTLQLRCPNCGIGRTFSGLFKANTLCSNCGVRFEREEGESVGGMYINLAAAELTSLGGFFLIQALFKPPVVINGAFWLIYNIVFVTLFYSRARSMWMGISYLTRGVYRDDEEPPQSV